MYVVKELGKYNNINFLKHGTAGLNSVFLLIDWLPHQGQRAQSALLKEKKMDLSLS